MFTVISLSFELFWFKYIPFRAEFRSSVNHTRVPRPLIKIEGYARLQLDSPPNSNESNP